MYISTWSVPKNLFKVVCIRTHLANLLLLIPAILAASSLATLAGAMNSIMNSRENAIANAAFPMMRLGIGISIDDR